MTKLKELEKSCKALLFHFFHPGSSVYRYSIKKIKKR